MLDLNFVRDNLELVKQKMRERGLGEALGGFESIDRERRKFLLEAETRKARRNKVSDEIAALKKAKQDASALIAEMKRGGHGNSGVGREGQAIRRAIARTPAHHSQPASRERSRWPRLRGEPGGSSLGHAPRVRLRTEGALGPWPGPGHPGFRAGKKDHRDALRRVQWCGSKAGTRAGQFHARYAHERARLYRDPSSLHRKLFEPFRHRPTCPNSRKTSSSSKEPITG